MIEEDMKHPSPIALHKALERVWGTPPGLARLAAVNHNIIGKRFMLTALSFFAIGGLLAMLIRTQLASSESAFMDAEQYAQIFTMHGSIMMFLFAIPFFEGVAIYLLPKLLGTRDLAFPRLTAYGYWCYLFGGSMLIAALIGGVAPNSGWFMYPPLSSNSYSPGINADVWLLAITFVEISALAAAIEIMVTVLKLRAAGMSLDKMPIFAWYMLVVATMMLVGFPPLIVGSVLLELERAFHLPFFDPSRGGDPLLWQHLFWLFGHPEVYIIFLPAAGAISTILPVFAGAPLAGYRLIVAALVAMAFLSFGLWVHHMYAVGIPHVALSFFSAASALVAVPTGIQIFAWLATLSQGRPRFSVPMLHILGFLFTFVIGGLTGVMLAIVPFDWQAHDTHFVVAHLHYVLVGGFVFPMLAAAYYWLPHLSGRQPVQHLSQAAFWMLFIGFHVTFFMMHLTGLRGMPRRIFEYPIESGWETLNFISSMGSFVMTMGFALVALDFILLFRFGRRHRRNPWRAGTLEWAMATPPPSYNFASLPSIERRADLLDPDQLGSQLASGKGYLGVPRHARMELLAVEMLSGTPEHVVRLPNQTFLPLWTAAATGCFFLSLLFKFYWLTPITFASIILLFLLWSGDTAEKTDVGSLPVGRGRKLPPHMETARPPSWWAMIFALAADATAYISLLFGCLFLWVSAPNWPPQKIPHVELAGPAIAAIALLVAAWAGRSAAARSPHAIGWLALTGFAHLVAAATLLWLAMAALPDPRSHALVSSVFVVLTYAALRSGLGIVISGYGIWRIRSGYVSQRRNVDLRLGRLWHDFSAVTGLAAAGFPFVMTILASELSR
ncbi:Cytochrome c oxidase polypeptide I (plasmid) [Sinorhizobium sojae CCBAU 05684]|uniref:cytochrome-c oxidase n=1 Tax=Sinorhizobium sojae CCBAU 05684 TaxID=716928 RepID=A0A249PMG6_9HYPH|nr:cytochrome c oxidase subunit I [Sinorhizobium sojae]ASY66947.1 Cytochrome c oxidase polypeptide I [Sinorhizobium sojae CCBAU 05684]